MGSGGSTEQQGGDSAQQSSSLTTERTYSVHTLGKRMVMRRRGYSRPRINTGAELFNSGNLSNNPATEQDKCYDPSDSTLVFVDGDDDHDFECNDYKSPRAKMSCGHSVTPISLTKWCRWLLDKGDSKFVCGVHGCDAEWSHQEVYKMALLTPEEMEYFDRQLFNRAAADHFDVKLCPGCKSRAERTDLNNLSVCCPQCTADKKKPFIFCWQCLKVWNNPPLDTNTCGNSGCISVSQEILRTCPDINFKDVSGVTGCPSIRACPICGLLVEHNRKRCKYIKCRRCKEKFCFVCLKLIDDCIEENVTYYTLCPSGVAPRQTSIPVWQWK